MGSVGNQTRDVLLELGQVVGNVTLCEHGVLIILHLRGNVRVEVCIFEVEHQILAQELQLIKRSLLIIDFLCVIQNLVSYLLVFVIHFLYALLDIILVHSRHFFIDIDLCVILEARVSQLIALLVQLIDIIEKLEVLLFALNVSRDDLVDIANTGCLHNCLECFLDDLCVTHVLVEQALLLDVFVLDAVEADH